ncbi:MAG: hemerythrin domain-containing protein [Betaproteobacteria bacterium]|nr:hemerythrin domain-containing protein [Betaproteobacteria bacterium]
MPSAITIIKDEHRSLSAVLQGLLWLCAEYGGGRAQADFGLLAAMLHYIGAFPERLHHPKEDEFLYRILRERHAGAGPILDELGAEHVRGRQLIAELNFLLECYRLGQPAAFDAFDQAVRAYADFHWAHMRKEEDAVLPMAERFLTPADWGEIDTAFRANIDPLAKADTAGEFRELFRRIVSLAPPPIGVGPYARPVS